MPTMLRILAALASFTALTVTAPASPAATGGVPAGSNGSTSVHTTDPKFVIRGAVEDRHRATVDDLRRDFAQHEAEVTYESGSGPQTHTFSGPLLHDVAMDARPRFDPAVKSDALAFAVVVTATDDYRAVLSWGEVDPGFGARGILLATEQDGEALARPRLVVPGDVKGGRYVSDVRTIVIRDLGRW